MNKLGNTQYSSKQHSERNLSPQSKETLTEQIALPLGANGLRKYVGM